MLVNKPSSVENIDFFGYNSLTLISTVKHVLRGLPRGLLTAGLLRQVTLNTGTFALIMVQETPGSCLRWATL